MKKRTKYLVMSAKDHPDLSWEKGMQETLGICHTLRKAYEIALFLSGITQPKISYRKSLSLIRANGAVRIDSVKEHEPSAIISLVRIY
jgi:hypothetical protein